MSLTFLLYIYTLPLILAYTIYHCTFIKGRYFCTFIGGDNL